MKDGVKIIGRAKQPEASHTQIQKAFIQYVKKACPGRAKYFVKITNEGKKEVGKLKAEGMHTGAFDLFYAEPVVNNQWIDELNRTGFIGSSHRHGLWIEIKRDKDKVSDEQYQFGILMRENHYDAVICFGLDMAIAVFEDYIRGKDLTKYLVK